MSLVASSPLTRIISNSRASLAGLISTGAGVIIKSEAIMKEKRRIASVATKKSPKQQISDSEFRRRLKNINEWRKQRLAELRAKNSR